MSSLHKFKILATQCALVSATPSQSPTTSPVIHLRRRRKTLRMLLSRNSDHHPSHHHHRRRLSRCEDPRSDIQKDPPENKRVRRKLKDLFVSSPPFDHKEKDHNNKDGTVASTASADDDDDVEMLPETDDDGVGSAGIVSSGGGGDGSGGLASRYRSGSLRPLSGTLRYRLLRRAWRPVLVTIPE